MSFCEILSLTLTGRSWDWELSASESSGSCSHPRFLEKAATFPKLCVSPGDIMRCDGVWFSDESGAFYEKYKAAVPLSWRRKWNFPVFFFCWVRRKEKLKLNRLKLTTSLSSEYICCKFSCFRPRCLSTHLYFLVRRGVRQTTQIGELRCYDVLCRTLCRSADVAGVRRWCRGTGGAMAT